GGARATQDRRPVRAVRAVSARRPGRAFRTLGAGRALRTGGTGGAGRALDTLRTLRAGGAGDRIPGPPAFVGLRTVEHVVGRVVVRVADPPEIGGRRAGAEQEVGPTAGPVDLGHRYEVAEEVDDQVGLTDGVEDVDALPRPETQERRRG